MNQASDLLTVKEAAVRAERSISTIKRWMRSGKLKKRRKGKGKTAPVYISSHELSMLTMDQTPARAANRATNQAPNQAQAELVDILKEQIADLRRDKASLQDDMRTTRKLLDESRERIAALERQLNGGVRGLLQDGLSAIKKRFTV